MTDPRELKPCPFCGGAGHVARVGRQMEIICQSCGAAGALSVDREEAIAAWNRRAATVPADVAGLRREHFEEAARIAESYLALWDEPGSAAHDVRKLAVAEIAAAIRKAGGGE